MLSASPAFKGGQLAVIEQVGAYLLVGIHLHVAVEFGCMAHIPEGVRVANLSGGDTRIRATKQTPQKVDSFSYTHQTVRFSSERSFRPSNF